MDEDLELGEEDHEEPLDFPPPERRVITQGYDLSIDTLVKQWDDGLLVLPELQREYVWDNGKASRLVESLLLSIPIPVLYFAETSEAKYEIIDGHQRVRSIVRYIKNEFALSSLRILDDLTRLRFHQLPDREQRFLRTRVIRAIIISADSHPTMKYEIFQRLNTGAIALNAQEIRNALNSGPLNDLLKELEQLAPLRVCIGRRSPRKRMVDRELVLRFLAFREGLSSYRPPLIRFLNRFMEDKRNAGEAERAAMRDDFIRAVSFNADVFGASAFRIADENGQALERNVNRALFDAQTFAGSRVTTSIADVDVARVHRDAAVLYENQVFRDAIQRATGDRSRTLRRIGMYGEMLSNAGVSLNLTGVTFAHDAIASA
jgi:Protein of unknown function DUF262